LAEEQDKDQSGSATDGDEQGKTKVWMTVLEIPYITSFICFDWDSAELGKETN
jgi:hypothetical protein